MSEKSTFNISIRLENVIKGLFTVLLSVVLAINAGKVARTLVFPLLYFTGAFYYVVLGYAAFRGLFRIFVGHKLKVKSIITNVGFVSLLIGFYLIIGYILTDYNGLTYSTPIAEALERYNGQLATYYQEVFINPFQGYWTNGLIGVVLSSLINSGPIVLAVGILIASIGLVLFLVAPIKFIFTYSRRRREEKYARDKLENGDKPRVIYKSSAKKEVKEKPVKEKREKKKKLKVKQEPEEIKIPEPEILPIQEEDEEFIPQYGFEPEENNFEEESSGFNENSISLDDSFLGKEAGEPSYFDFKPLSFDGNNYQINNRNSFVESRIQEAPIHQEIKQEPVFVEKPVFDEIEEVEEFIDYEPEIDKSSNDDFTPLNVAPPAPTPSITPIPVPENEPLSSYNPTPTIEKPKKRERVNWVSPSSELLDTYETSEAISLNTKVAEERMILINQILADFRIGARCTSYTIGSSVTRFNIEYDASVSSKSVEKYVEDISRRLNGVNARFTPIVAGEIYSGLEVANATITTVGFKEVYEALPDVKKHPLAVGFGKDISGNVICADFDEFPHLLVAGTTGSGKSIYIHSIIATLIMRVSPDDLKIVLVDPKKVEMTKYRDMPHLLCPIITEASKAKVMLSKLVDEMNDRYEKFAVADSCSNIKQYNEWAKEHNIDQMPYIIIVLDEYADLVDTCKEISQPVVSIAQKARAAGIHMLISTQRPSTNVITGVIKGNLPTHVALMTSSYTDSMTILGEGGAEKLLGKGDMLVQSPLVSRVGLTRLQGCYIQNREIGRIVGYLKEHYETIYDENYMDLVDHSKDAAMTKVASGEVEKEADAAEEAKYQSIKEWVMTQQFVSMSKIQRECGVGFNRAGRFFNRLQQEGVVSTTQDGSTKGCKVLVHDGDDYSDIMVTSDELIG